jgi:membrane-associated protein
MHFDLAEWIRSFGYFGVWAIVLIIFFESFLLFFLPGDSLLFIGGFLASTGSINIWVLVFGCFAAAVLGNNVGYALGQKYGRRFFLRENSRLFTQDNLTRTQDFYDKHGGKTIILARFLPIVRTFAPVVAGIGTMKYKVFTLYNLVGASLWAIGLPLAGYFLGKRIDPKVMEANLIWITLGIIVTSLVPSVLHVLLDKKKS